MSAINFFEQFAAINLTGNDESLTNDFSKLAIKKQNMKNEKNMENEKTKNIKKEKKSKKFIHGNNVVMLCGQYKGYNGFVYEYFPEKLTLLVDEERYVEAGCYIDNNIGDYIMTPYGNAKILLKIESLNNVYVSSVDENGKDTSYEIRLPAHCFKRYVTFFDNGVLKIAELLSVRGDYYKMAVVDVSNNGSKKMDKQELMAYISKCFKTNGLTYNGKITKLAIECSDEFYIVCKHPANRNDKDLFGIYGKLKSSIPEQLLVSVKCSLSVNKNSASIDGKKVKVKSGLYKNKTGELVNIDDAYLSVQIEAVNKIISDHYVCLSNGHSTRRKIIPSDVFYMDFELKNGNYFQVTECYDNVFVGIEKVQTTFVEKTISNQDIHKIMPGFIITDKVVGTQAIQESNHDNCFVLDSIDEECEIGDDDYDEHQEAEYGDGSNDVVDDYEYERTEGEMKETFKDTERSGFVEKSLTKEESEYMKMIVKCCDLIGEVQSPYLLVDKVSDIVKIMKTELQKISVTDWCQSDTKYIVACLVAYEVMKSGLQMTIYDFRKYGQKLYDSGVIKASTITNSGFIRCEDNLNADSCWYSICMSDEDKHQFKQMYKMKKYDNLVKDIMERCHKMLGIWFGPVCFALDVTKMELIPVAKPNTKREYPKYFLTTQDIVTNNTVETAKRIVWGPESQKLVNVWKKSLNERLQKENNQKIKTIYHFVRDNIDNAPFVLKNLETSSDKMDQLKHKELKRTFDMFKDKLRTYVENNNQRKNKRLTEALEEKHQINNRREEISKRRKCTVKTSDTNLEMDEVEVIKLSKNIIVL